MSLSEVLGELLGGSLSTRRKYLIKRTVFGSSGSPGDSGGQEPPPETVPGGFEGAARPPEKNKKQKN